MGNLVHLQDELVICFDDGLVFGGFGFKIGFDLDQILLDLPKLSDIFAVTASDGLVLGFERNDLIALLPFLGT